MATLLDIQAQRAVERSAKQKFRADQTKIKGSQNDASSDGTKNDESTHGSTSAERMKLLRENQAKKKKYADEIAKKRVMRDIADNPTYYRSSDQLRYIRRTLLLFLYLFCLKINEDCFFLSGVLDLIEISKKEGI